MIWVGETLKTMLFLVIPTPLTFVLLKATFPPASQKLHDRGLDLNPNIFPKFGSVSELFSVSFTTAWHFHQLFSPSLLNWSYNLKLVTCSLEHATIASDSALNQRLVILCSPVRELRCLWQSSQRMTHLLDPEGKHFQLKHWNIGQAGSKATLCLSILS